MDAYTLSFAGLLLTGGALAERLGGRRVFTAGLVVFGAASAACGLAPSLPLLVGGAADPGRRRRRCWCRRPCCCSRPRYTDPRQRVRAFGMWGAIAGVGAASGPIVGGVLVTAWSWRGVFFLNLPFAVAALAWRRRAFPVTPRRGRAPSTCPASCWPSPGWPCSPAALVEAGRLGWSASDVLAGFALAVRTLIAFVAAERRSRTRCCRCRCSAGAGSGPAAAVGLLINFGLYGQLFVLSLYFQDLRGYSALGTGLALLPEAALLIVASALSGRIMAQDRAA